MLLGYHAVRAESISGELRFHQRFKTTQNPTEAAVAPDGQLLLLDNRIWTADGQEAFALDLEVSGSWQKHLFFSKDGRYALVGDPMGELYLLLTPRGLVDWIRRHLVERNEASRLPGTQPEAGSLVEQRIRYVDLMMQTPDSLADRLNFSIIHDELAFGDRPGRINRALAQGDFSALEQRARQYVADCRRILERFPSSEMNRILSQKLNALASWQLFTGKYAAALANAREAIQLAGDDGVRPRITELLALLLAEQPEVALKLLRQIKDQEVAYYWDTAPAGIVILDRLAELREGGVWRPGFPEVAAIILDRELTEAEIRQFGLPTGKK